MNYISYLQVWYITTINNKETIFLFIFHFIIPIGLNAVAIITIQTKNNIMTFIFCIIIIIILHVLHTTSKMHVMMIFPYEKKKSCIKSRY